MVGHKNNNDISYTHIDDNNKQHNLPFPSSLLDH